MVCSPMALIIPAISHSGVIIYAVAARDKARATAFAQKHNIPVVKDSYEGVYLTAVGPVVSTWAAEGGSG